jgi:hypothetical protein
VEMREGGRQRSPIFFSDGFCGRMTALKRLKEARRFVPKDATSHLAREELSGIGGQVKERRKKAAGEVKGAEGDADLSRNGADALDDAIVRGILEDPDGLAKGVIDRAKGGDPKALDYVTRASQRSAARKAQKKERLSVAARWSAEPEWDGDEGRLAPVESAA